MRRLLALVLVPLATVAGCPPEPPPVVVFGDSNVAMARTNSGLDATWHATPGYSIDDWWAEMLDVPDGATVVVGLGSNDLLEHDAAVEVDVHNALVALSGADCVVWLTVNEPSFDALGLGDDARAFNGNLRWQADGRPNVTVSGWATTETQPTDPVHLTAKGYRDYAAALAAAAEACP